MDLKAPAMEIWHFQQQQQVSVQPRKQYCLISASLSLNNDTSCKDNSQKKIYFYRNNVVLKCLTIVIRTDGDHFSYWISVV